MGKGERKHLWNFLKSRDGVVTVEWVALAGSLVIGAITVGWLVMNNLQTPAKTVGTNITACETSAAKSGGSTTGCQ